jgi:hypothetical protein
MKQKFVLSSSSSHDFCVVSSPNHLVRPEQHGLRNVQSDLLRRIKIDDQLKLRRPIHPEWRNSRRLLRAGEAES